MLECILQGENLKRLYQLVAEYTTTFALQPKDEKTLYTAMVDASNTTMVYGEIPVDVGEAFPICVDITKDLTNFFKNLKRDVVIKNDSGRLIFKHGIRQKTVGFLNPEYVLKFKTLEEVENMWNSLKDHVKKFTIYWAGDTKKEINQLIKDYNVITFVYDGGNSNKLYIRCKEDDSINEDVVEIEVEDTYDEPVKVMVSSELIKPVFKHADAVIDLYIGTDYPVKAQIGENMWVIVAPRVDSDY